MKKTLLLLFTITLVMSAQQQNLPKREVRGAWVATVANIDWPTSNAISSGEQIKELVEMFDSLKAAGINTILFQARTECDALYESSFEPWSYWVSGEQGKAPEPYFDPLQFAINEARIRGMELHAWLNPYRAVRDIEDYVVDDSHVSVTHPEWILQFGKLKILDPGHPGVRKFILDVVTDIVTRYDVDGIHFDDYFYPYTPIQNEDSLTFAHFNRGIDSIDNWRRNSINILMEDIYVMINAVKPHVKFGISPFGIVLNEYAGTDGFNSYNILFCDPLTWINDKTVDYINPQLYWEMDHERAPFSKLLPWWASVKGDRQLFVGHYSSKMASGRYEGNPAELGNQIRMSRLHGAEGSIYFSAKSISRNWSGLADSMKNDWYKYPAVPPAMYWKDKVSPNSPVNVFVVKDSVNTRIVWDAPSPAVDGESPYYYVVYGNPDKIDIDNPAHIISFVDASAPEYIIPEELRYYIFSVSAMDRLHNESEVIRAVSK